MPRWDSAHYERYELETPLIWVALNAMLETRVFAPVVSADYSPVDGARAQNDIHVSDLAYANVVVIEELTTQREVVVNSDTDRGYPVRHVINGVEQLSDVVAPVSNDDRRCTTSTRTVAVNEIATKVLGW